VLGVLQLFVSLIFYCSYLISLLAIVALNRIVANVDKLMALCDRLEAQLSIPEADSRPLEALLHKSLDVGNRMIS
jgi:hypothetical protein